MTIKTTVYLPDELKEALQTEARRRGKPEAELIRQAIAAFITRPRPQPAIVEGEPMAEHSSDLLAGFGEK